MRPPQMPPVDPSRWRPLSRQGVLDALDQTPYREAARVLVLFRALRDWVRRR